MTPIASQPLKGKQIWVTRPEDLFCPLRLALESRGASVTQVPLITIIPTSFQLLKELHGYDWLFFTSKAGIQYFFSNPSFTKDVLNPFPRIGLVGEASRKFLQDSGRDASFVSSVFTGQDAAQTFLEQFSPKNPATHQPWSILWPCGNRSQEELYLTLKQAGLWIDPLIVYETSSNLSSLDLVQTFFTQPPDVLTFTSPSAVETFAQAFGQNTIPLAPTTKIAVIGPTTGKSALQLLGRLDIQASPHTLIGLTEAIEGYFTRC